MLRTFPTGVVMVSSSHTMRSLLATRHWPLRWMRCGPASQRLGLGLGGGALACVGSGGLYSQPPRTAGKGRAVAGAGAGAGRRRLGLRRLSGIVLAASEDDGNGQSSDEGGGSQVRHVCSFREINVVNLPEVCGGATHGRCRRSIVNS